MRAPEVREGYAVSPDRHRIFSRHIGSGERPTVLLLHSLGTSHRLWDAQLPALVEKFDVLTPDLRGHGASDVPPPPYDLASLGQDVAAVLDAHGIERAHVIGLSMGGMVAMWLAINQPNLVQSLVIANSAAFIPAKEIWDRNIDTALSSGMGEIAGPTIRSWLSASFQSRDPVATQSLINAMRSMNPGGYAGACAVLRDTDLRDDLVRIAAPSLVLNGGADGPRGESAANLVSAGIPDSRRCEVPGAGHLSNLDNPTVFNALVKEFLEANTHVKG